jgi:hypothetical protein
MASKAIGLLETRGLTALVTGVDAMLKSANVSLYGPMKQVGNALVSAVVIGDVAAVKAATDAGAQAARTFERFKNGNQGRGRGAHLVDGVHNLSQVHPGLEHEHGVLGLVHRHLSVLHTHGLATGQRVGLRHLVGG